MSVLLSVHNLSAAFQQADQWVEVVKKISFSIHHGQTVAIVGESGSGKSITSLSIMQLLNETGIRYLEGSIEYYPRTGDKVELLRCRPNELQQLRGSEIAMIFQEPMTSLNPLIKCGLQITEAIILHEKVAMVSARRSAIRLLQEVQLSDPEEVFEKYPYQLSGGQKQRVMIAMAMSCNPRLLIADEPTTALDVLVQKEILSLLKQLQQQRGMSMLFVSHDLALIYKIANKVIVMDSGEIVEQGDKNVVFNQPSSAYTRGLLMCRPALYNKGETLPVVGDFLNASAKTFVHQKSLAGGKQTEQSEVLLEGIDLSVEYKNRFTLFNALNKVNLKIYKGESLGLVGASGSGKSTLGRALLRLLPLSNGDVFFKGKSVTGLTSKQLRAWRREVQLIFQDPYAALNPRITVGHALEEVLAVHGIGTRKDRRDRVIHMLEQVDMEASHHNRYPHQFSGGQRQRIGIARALILEPEMIVCDESVSALDVSVQAQVLNLLNELKLRFGFTILFISHDLSVVKYMCDRIAVMHKGEIIELGEAEKLYNNPVTIQASQLIAAIPKMEIQL